MKKFLLCVLALCVMACVVDAQQSDVLLCMNSSPRFEHSISSDYPFSMTPQNIQVRNQSFYRQLDFESGNIFTLAGFSFVSALLNQASDKLCKNAFLVTPISAKADAYDVDVETYKWNKMEVEDLFKDVQIGGRLGYHSYHGMFNAGFYASVHYKVNQFKMQDGQPDGEFLKHGVHRVMFGLTSMFIIGEFAGLESSSGLRTYIELGIRYAVATKYDNPYNLDKSALNNGVVSHFAVYISPNSRFFTQDIGVFFDINHYDLFKNNDNPSVVINSLKMWTLGIQYCITRKQAAKR